MDNRIDFSVVSRFVNNLDSVDFAILLGNFVSGRGTSVVERGVEIGDGLRYVHRTLQQMVIGLLLCIIFRYGHMNSEFVDERNEASWKACRKIAAQFEQQYGKGFPLY